MSPDRTTLVVGILEDYKIVIAKIIARGLHNLVVSTDTTLGTPYLLIQICLKEGIPMIFVIDQFMMVHKNTDSSLIWDFSNPILKSMVGTLFF